MNRDEAWEIVKEFTESDSLRRHMLATGFAMRKYAEYLDGDPEKWEVVGLLHDFDYERYPDVSEQGHPVKGAQILEERGVSEEIRRAILSHAPEITGVKPESDMEKALMAVDELTGFITAVALVRPSQSVNDVKWSSIKKKWNNKSFAAGVDREHIEEAVKDLGVDFQEHVMRVLEAMQERAEVLGLD